MVMLEAGVLPISKVYLGALSKIRQHLAQGRPDSSVEVVSITEVSVSPRTIAQVEPFLPVGRWLLQQLC
jgi:hypothetical protein